MEVIPKIWIIILATAFVYSIYIFNIVAKITNSNKRPFKPSSYGLSILFLFLGYVFSYLTKSHYAITFVITSLIYLALNFILYKYTINIKKEA